MASLKDMRVRLASTKATQKITKAMQMVAASKLRRAQAAAEAARPYAERMEKVLGNIASTVADINSAQRLLAGTGPPDGRQRGRCRLAVVDQREQVTTHAAHVLGGDGQHRAGRNGGIGRRAARAQDGHARCRGEMVHGADHAVRREDGRRIIGGMHRRTVTIGLCPETGPIV